MQPPVLYDHKTYSSFIQYDTQCLTLDVCLTNDIVSNMWSHASIYQTSLTISASRMHQRHPLSWDITDNLCEEHVPNTSFENPGRCIHRTRDTDRSSTIHRSSMHDQELWLNDYRHLVIRSLCVGRATPVTTIATRLLPTTTHTQAQGLLSEHLSGSTCPISPCDEQKHLKCATVWQMG